MRIRIRNQFFKVLEDRQHRRCGAMIALCAFVLIMLFAFVAFTVDIGYITLTKSQLEKSADAAALSSMLDLMDGLGPDPELSQADAEAQARQTAVDVAANNHAAGLASVRADANNDVRVGRVDWDPVTSSWVKTWGSGPYNMVEVTLRRAENVSGTNDGPLPLFFAPLIGSSQATVSGKAIAAVFPAAGFRLAPGSPGTVKILPIALDLGTWNQMIAGGGSDDFKWDASSKTVVSGSDGVREINLYPTGSNLLPPGNRGTVDLGGSDNSTNDLKRQILHGLNADDLSYFGGEISTENGPMFINGDTGISAGMKAQLATIIGKARAIPIFTQVSSPGNNATYTIVRFVGIRILEVNLTGSNKRLIVQPAIVFESNAIPGSGIITTGSVITGPLLIR